MSQKRIKLSNEQVMCVLNSFVEENNNLKKENEELKNKISFLKKRIKCNN